MKQYSKQFTAWATDLTRKIKSNHFFYARLRLTILYTIVTMAIVTIFSLALFVSLEKNVLNFIDEDQGDLISIQNHKFKSSIGDIENTIVYVDFFLLFLVLGIGYIIAGKVLEPIKENMETQRRFLADASHDLRTPLAIMKSESQVLVERSSQNIDDYKEVIKSNLEEIDKMTSLIQDLLLIARSDSDTLELSITENINIQELIQKLILRMKTEFDKKSINIKIDSSTTKLIKGNSQNIERAIQNILQNSINYTRRGGKVFVDIKEDEKKISIKISDTGVGIKESDLSHVFDRFFKAEHSRNDVSGSGLGLPIAKQIIEQHGGKIEIFSKLNQGSQVIIFIPIT